MADSENHIEVHESKNAHEIVNESFSDELLILSEVDGSDEDIGEAVLSSSSGVEMKDNAVNPVNMDVVSSASKSVENEQNKKDDSVAPSPKTSSELDDFDLDDVIEEFAKEESKIAKLDDELDCLVDEFVEAECLSPKTEVKIVLSDSDDDMVILEDFKAANSDDECLIVEDSHNEIVIKDDDDVPLKSKVLEAKPAQTKELQSTDNETNRLSSNLVTTELSDDIQEITVMNMNTPGNVEAGALSKPAPVTDLNTSEQEPQHTNSCESQATLHALNNNDTCRNADPKLACESIISRNEQDSIHMIDVENDKSDVCNEVKIAVVDTLHSSDQESSDFKQVDDIDSCGSVALFEDNSHKAVSKLTETLDTGTGTAEHATGSESETNHSCENMEIVVLDTMQSSNLKLESDDNGTENSNKMCCDLPNMEVTAVVNENLENLSTSSAKAISKSDENDRDIQMVTKDVLNDMLNNVTSSEGTLMKETNENDQIQANPILTSDALSATVKSVSESSLNCVSHSMTEKGSEETNDSEILEACDSFLNEQNKTNSITEDTLLIGTCVNSDSLPSSVSHKTDESVEENNIEILESSLKSDATDSVSVVKDVVLNTMSDLSPSPVNQIAVEETKNEVENITETFEGNTSENHQDEISMFSAKKEVAEDRTCAVNCDSFPYSVGNNIVSICSPKKIKSDVEIIEDPRFSEEEGGQDEIIIDSIKVKRKSSISESTNIELKSLIPLSDEKSNDSKKRKIDEIENEDPVQVAKKIREEDSTEMEIACVDSIADNKIKEVVLDLIPEKNTCTMKTKKKYLDKIARSLCCQTVQDLFTKECTEERCTIKDLEEKLQALDEDLMLFKTQASELHAAQEATFEEHKYNPKVHSRTVGVNVKIFRECDIPPDKIPVNKIQAPVPVLNQDKPKTMLSVLKNTILAKAPAPVNFQPRPLQMPTKEQLQKVQFYPQSAPPQRMSVPKVLTRANVQPPPRFYPVAPNVTMVGNPLAVAAPGMSRCVVPRPSTAASNVRPSIGSNVIDLTDDESTAANKKLLPAGTNISIPTTVSKVNLPAVSGNQQNVFVPITSFLQMLPSAQGQTIRQGLVPSLAKGLGKQTYTCILPNNTTTTRAAVSTLVPPPNRVQFVLQVPNAGSMHLNKIVNTSTRFLGTAPSLNTNTTYSKTAQSASASDLCLTPRVLAHPAPFPPIPSYPPSSKLKALPPKPSLKGSKAPNGIILSWNMAIFNSHAQVTNYQLFAYQETAGPVTASLWKKVGDVNALPLPMACTLTQFVEGHRYYFTVRAVDTYSRIGPFSDPVSIMYSLDKTTNSKSLT